MSEMSAIPELRDMEQLTFPAATITAVVRMKAPRRILHFSDGTMEEYSTDDEIDAENEKNMQLDVVSIRRRKWKKKSIFWTSLVGDSYAC